MQIRSGRYHTLLIKDSAVYSCGSSLCGVLGHGPETTQCVEFTPINFPSLAQVMHVSASHNHAAFVTNSGEVCNCSYLNHLLTISHAYDTLLFAIYSNSSCRCYTKLEWKE